MQQRPNVKQALAVALCWGQSEQNAILVLCSFFEWMGVHDWPRESKFANVIGPVSLYCANVIVPVSLYCTIVIVLVLAVLNETDIYRRKWTKPFQASICLLPQCFQKCTLPTLEEQGRLFFRYTGKQRRISCMQKLQMHAFRHFSEIAFDLLALFTARCISDVIRVWGICLVLPLMCVCFRSLY